MKYGVYGVGRIGRIHAKIVMDLGNEISCIGDDARGAVMSAVNELSLNCDTYLNPKDMIENHPEMEAVIIASHTRDHARHALPFIRAGVPVFLEKPLTDNLTESFEFVKDIGTDENIVQIGLQRRFDEALTHAKKIIDEGLLGEIREIRSVLRDQNPPPETYKSGGLIIDTGIHVADEVIWLTGEFPVTVGAWLLEAKEYHSPIDEGGNTAFVGFTTTGGTIGRLDLSRTHSSGYNNETYIIGTSGTLHVGRFSGYPGPIPVELWKKDGTKHEISKTFEMSYPEGEYPEFLPRFEKAYIESHKQFGEAVKNKGSFRVTQNDVLKAQVFVEAAHRSAKENGKVFEISHSEDLEEFKSICYEKKLLD